MKVVVELDVDIEVNVDVEEDVKFENGEHFSDEFITIFQDNQAMPSYPTFKNKIWTEIDIIQTQLWE